MDWGVDTLGFIETDVWIILESHQLECEHSWGHTDRGMNTTRGNTHWGIDSLELLRRGSGHSRSHTLWGTGTLGITHTGDFTALGSPRVECRRF